MRVRLFVACLDDLLFPEVGQAVVRLLSRLGQEVEFPERQTCCGQMHFQTGYRDECIPLVRRFADVSAGYDAVVTPSPSCAAMVRHHHGTVARDARDDALEPSVAEVVPHVFELTEFLIDAMGIRDVGAVFTYTVGITAVDDTGLIADPRARSVGVSSNQSYRSETHRKPRQARPSWSRLETGSMPGGIGRREAWTTAIA